MKKILKVLRNRKTRNFQVSKPKGKDDFFIFYKF